MRIGINALAVSPERPGGDVTYVLELARRLPALAPDVDWLIFLAPRARPLFGQLPANAHLVHCPVPAGSLVVRALYEQSMLVPIATRQRLDLLFAPVNVLPVAYPGRMLLTLHEAEPFMPNSLIPVPLLAWWRVMRSLSARRATRILTVSNAARDDLVRYMHLDPTKIDVIHLGVDLDRFSPAVRDRQPRPLDDPYVLWVGRPYPRKNLDTLLTAYAHLRQAGRREKLVLIGPPGWNEAALLRRIRTEFPPDTVLRLPANWSDLPRWYAHAAAFVFPSTQETFGLPVLEALASATPTLASNIPALREIAGDAANYFPPNSATSLAEAMLRTLDDGRSIPIMFGGRLREQASPFSWDAAAARTRDRLLPSVYARSHTAGLRH